MQHIDRVRTVTPAEDVSPTVSLNIIKMIVDVVPKRLDEIKAELKDIEKQSNALIHERVKLEKMLNIAQEPLDNR